MKCIVCEQPNELKLIDVERPDQRAGEAIVNVKRVGVCGTDLHAFKGNQPFFTYPRILGHELAGVIDWVGDNRFGLKKGDQVAIIPYMACGDCIACRNGKSNCCKEMKVLGVHIDGGMRDQISIPYGHLMKTDGLSMDQTAIIEPLSIGAHAVRRANIKKGERVLVIGAGPIGLGLMAFAKREGATVIAMDINEERLAFCRQWANVDSVINSSQSPIEQLKKITDGDMPTIVFDATGNSGAMMNSFHYPAYGGTLMFVGLVKEDITFSDSDFHAKELTLMASRNATREDFAYVMNAMKQGDIEADRYISHRIEFEQVVDQFNGWAGRGQSNVVKALINL